MALFAWQSRLRVCRARSWSDLGFERGVGNTMRKSAATGLRGSGQMSDPSSAYGLIVAAMVIALLIIAFDKAAEFRNSGPKQPPAP